MVKPDRCCPCVEWARIRSNHSLSKVSRLQPLIDQIVFNEFSHRPVEEYSPRFFVATKPLVNLFTRRSLADPKISVACGTQCIARPANHIAHRAPALDIARGEASNLIFAPLVVVPELNAGVVQKGNEESVDRGAPFKAARGKIQLRNNQRMQQPGKIGAWRHAHAGKRFFDRTSPTHTRTAFKYDHALACPRQIGRAGESVMARSDHDHIPCARCQLVY